MPCAVLDAGAEETVVNDRCDICSMKSRGHTQRARFCPDFICTAWEGFLEEVVFKLNSEEPVGMSQVEKQDVHIEGEEDMGGKASEQKKQLPRPACSWP